MIFKVDFIWYGNEAEVAGRGSSQEGLAGWYRSFISTQHWR